MAHGESIVAEDLVVRSNTDELAIANAPTVRFQNIKNYGKIVLRTDRNAVANAEGHIEYNFDGNLFTRMLFVVQHNNLQVPLHVNFRGESGGDTSDKSVSANYREMVLVSNGPAKLKDKKEFEFDMYKPFLNRGRIAVVGGNSHRAQMRLALVSNAKPDAAFINNGLLYVKNADLIQEVDVLLRGCIVLGPGAAFYTNSSLFIGDQKFHFLAGSATLFIASSRENMPQKYVITTFPAGSKIQFERHMTDMYFEGGHFVVSSELGDEEVLIEFRIPGRWSHEKFLFSDNQLTFDGALNRFKPHQVCRQYPVFERKAFFFEKALNVPVTDQAAVRNVPFDIGMERETEGNLEEEAQGERDLDKGLERRGTNPEDVEAGHTQPEQPQKPHAGARAQHMFWNKVKAAAGSNDAEALREVKVVA